VNNLRTIITTTRTVSNAVKSFSRADTIVNGSRSIQTYF